MVEKKGRAGGLKGEERHEEDEGEANNIEKETRKGLKEGEGEEQMEESIWTMNDEREKGENGKTKERKGKARGEEEKQITWRK